MKSPLSYIRDRRVAAVLGGAIFLPAALLGLRKLGSTELPSRLTDIVAGDPLERIVYLSESLPSGAVTARRPPRDAVKMLDEAVRTEPAASELFKLRALEEEGNLDPKAAEADWKRHAELAANPREGKAEVAEFYGRRLQPELEVEWLLQSALMPDSAADLLKPVAKQESWKLFERIFDVVQEQALSATVVTGAYEAWIQRYPAEPEVYKRYFQFLIGEKNWNAAEALIGRYREAFPKENVFPVQARADLALDRGSADEAVAVYDREFQPLWPPDLIKDYFELLKKTGRERDFLAQARNAQAANPLDLVPAVRVFYYYQQEGNLPEAGRALADFRRRKEAAIAAGGTKTASGSAPSAGTWKASELYTLAQLSEDTNSYDEAARYYYALYSLPDAQASDAEAALAGLTRALLTAPEQPIRFGLGDLSFYHDVATMDPYPGFLNGILSLLFNTSDPKGQFQSEDQTSIAYFHRARAERLLALFDARFPKSPLASSLHAQLISAYAVHGANDGIIEAGRDFLAKYSDAPERTDVGLAIADAFAREKRPDDELAIYDNLLKDLAPRAANIPLGEGAVTESAGRRPRGEPSSAAIPQPSSERPRVPSRFGQPAPSPPARAGVRSPDYSRVLDRYLARLVALQRLPDAIKVFRTEIGRNPDDPGLYARFAAFLDENHLGGDLEEVYRLAIERFHDRGWYDRLARWYLARRRTADLSRITQQVVDTFSGTDLEDYFGRVVARAQIGPQLYLQLNLYAHQRFPHDMVFVRNLLTAYSSKSTQNLGAGVALLEQNWLEADDLRARYFAYLAGSGRLEAELDAVRKSLGKDQNPAEAASVVPTPAANRFMAEAELWRSDFESAALALEAVNTLYPADISLGGRTAHLDRSLASEPPAFGYDTEAAFRSALRVANTLQAAYPANREFLTELGEINADRQHSQEAAHYWSLIPRTAPGSSEAYLEAATVFWDYFQFDDALAEIAIARKQLHKPTLYGYQTGAIDESKRDYGRAIAEYAQDAINTPEPGSRGDLYSESRQRLLTLAKRPPLRALVDAATTPRSLPPSPGALRLRVAVLETENRRGDLESLLAQTASSAKTPNLLEQVSGVAQQDGFEDVQQHAVEREIALTNDPVHRIELRLALVNMLEARGQIPAAAQAMDALLGDEPKILGVVRAATDFYWRNHMTDRAENALLHASEAAYPDLRKKLILEAAQKTTESGDYAKARALVDKLLAEEPYTVDYLAAKAETFARAGDDSGLREFYLTTIGALQKAPIPDSERASKVAGLRRGLIPALTRLKDYAATVDQYVEAIKLYPEDPSLAAEAALYAQQHQQAPRLLGYFNDAVRASPKDPRWPIVLARLEVQLEDFGAALTAYNQALKLRPERVDLYLARGDLEERLSRFGDAAATYEKLYEISYHDPQWAEKAAAEYARLGQSQAAVAALDRALVRGQPERPQKYFAVARQMDAWSMLEPAREYAERGMTAAGDRLLMEAGGAADAGVYARIMTRLRQPQQALRRLVGIALHAPAASTGATPTERSPVRAEVAANLVDALNEMGRAVDRYYSPEEKLDFGQFLDKERASLPPQLQDQVTVQLAETAGLTDYAAKWRYASLTDSITTGVTFAPAGGAVSVAPAGAEVAVASPGVEPSGAAQPLVDLQTRCLRFQELGRQLESYAAGLRPGSRSTAVLQQATEAFQFAEDSEGELRTLAILEARGQLSGATLSRYLELLLMYRPDQLVVLVQHRGASRVNDAVASFAIANAGEPLALRVIAARGSNMPEVWTKAYTALAGLYDADSNPTIWGAFTGILERGPIGQQLGKPVDRSRQLAGDPWFYYGSRYGEYLTLGENKKADDYLPAMLEAQPGNPSGYVVLADFNRDRGRTDDALADYDHALELDPLQGAAEDRAAEILWNRGDHDDALRRWRETLSIFARQQDLQRVPETFWDDASAALTHIGEHKLLPKLRSEANSLLRTYVRRNGEYRAEPLMHAAYSAAADPSAGVAWIIDLSRAANNPVEFLNSLVDAAWIPEANREAIYQHALDLLAQDAAQGHGDARNLVESNLNPWRLRWAGYLIDRNDPERAEQALDAIPASEARSSELRDAIYPLELQIAAKRGRLDALLARYRNDPDKAPGIQILLDAAAKLQRKNDPTSSRQVLEYLYNRELDARHLSAANFLGLAEIRLQERDVLSALTLLHRMVLVATPPEITQPRPRGDGDSSVSWIDNLKPASELLRKYRRFAEAVEFDSEWTKAEPWSDDAKLQLAEDLTSRPGSAGQDLDRLRTVAADAHAAYDTRAQAALAFGKAKPGSPAGLSGELALLAGGNVSAEAASKPYFYFARMRAADETTDVALKVSLLHDAVGVRPGADPVRVQLFEAAHQAGQNRLAIQAFKPITRSFQYLAESYNNSSAGDEYERESSEADTFYAPNQFPPALGEGAGRAKVIEELGEAYVALDQLAVGRSYLALARRLDESAAGKARIMARMATVEAQLKREHENAARTPVVSAEVAQPGLVRPRLTAQPERGKP